MKLIKHGRAYGHICAGFCDTIEGFNALSAIVEYSDIKFPSKNI